MTTQLTLFEGSDAKRQLSGMPPQVQRQWELAWSLKIERRLLAVAAGRQGEWLNGRPFRDALKKYEIGHCIGHVLGHLARTGKLDERKVYLGKGMEADRPGSPDYRGFNCEWRKV